MTFWRKTGRWSAAFTAVALLLFATFVSFRSVERFYYAYAAPSGDDLTMRHIKPTWEIGTWAVAGGLTS